METGRASKSGRIYATGAKQRGFSPIFITATLSVVVLLALGAIQIERAVQAKNAATSFIAAGASAATGNNALGIDTSTISNDGSAQSDPAPTDSVSQIGDTVLAQLVGAYATLQQAGAYSTSTGVQAASTIAESLRATLPYRSFVPTDVKTDSDISYQRMLTYRADLRASLAPLLKNTQPEYEIFALYVDTKDRAYLTKLQSVAQHYRDAAEASANVVVPRDALPYHVAILNALEEFGATLDAMAAHADDPFASVALLRTYDQAESDVLASFNALVTYETQKQP